ncbi:tRNA (adenosine(37)-N6)-threonylcarbamoyltransferase complex ATPase subunit type 1 TsaE [Flavobacteriaceae bacterium F89]|uniref:tRNA threonylcarbamoyladenosine biosynthesis protein TsaE n=1 Tax=Cerina litoralis TaxID=2874477 RepID=A0AAE3JRH0_9FLAO|nr:tRNA (adenosine(37)-N6)-threonylcarbamoyltransferase complex ATPase subunit type 1 TsaE [Cerina litoralis]MCG2461338.1 tRNA (adenosine(37)-N6)-threonylcarbamoyltransferase complex ATPase subunit type 1 TsaE [Cerina litoralis]
MELIFNLKGISDIASRVIQFAPSKTLAFHGEMGTGKTTLIKAIVKELGGKGSTSSPTFGIVNEYVDENGKLLAYHFDFFRLNNASEALDMGLEDYLYSGAWILMEWPEKIAGLLPLDTTDVFLEVVDADTRRFRIELNG